MNEDITDIEDGGPDTELRECWELSPEEQHIIEAFRGMTEEGKKVIWELLRLAYAARREAADE